MRGTLPLVWFLLQAACLSGDVVINEFLASNKAVIADEDLDYSDYIELHNRGPAAVPLGGMFLTDDAADLQKWRVPEMTLEAGAFLVVFASGKDRANPAGALHTNFSIARGGEYLALVAADGLTVIDAYQPAFPAQFEDVSYGIWAGDGRTITFLQPSPGAANTQLYPVVAAPEFDVPHGFHASPFVLRLTTPSPGAKIHYSLDGSIPDAATGRLYDPAAGIEISDTTIVRAAASIDGFPPSRTVTASHIFLESVVRQGKDQTARGFPKVWVINRSDYRGSRKLRAADYEMDPAIPIGPGDLATLPSVSLVLPQKDLWDANTGIYVNSHMDASADPSWERACSVEYLDPASGTTFSADAGVRVFGGAASSPDLNDKMGLRLVFRGEYGPGRLDTDMFARVGPAANRLNTIVLRSHWGSSFLRNPALTGWAGETYPWEACYMRDVYANESYRATGQLNPRSMMVHLYLNGLYWGLYEAMERPDDSFNAENRGGSDEDYDVIVGEDSLKGYNGALHSGSLVNYRKLFSYFDTSASGSNLSTVTPVSEQALAEVAKYLDLPAFCDYMITLWVLNRLDFPNKNWYGASRRGEPGQPPEQPFVFFTWDSEACLWFDASFNRKIQWDERSVAERWNLLADRDYCQIRLYRRLKLNDTFRRLWADRTYKHLFNAGALSREALLDRWDRLAAGLDPAIHGELARWGDWVPLYADNPVTKADWSREVALVRDHIISDRVDLVVSQMREFGIYPELDPPVIGQSSPQVWPDERVRLDAGGQYGEIRYTIDGADPRLAGATYTQPIPVHRPMLLRAAMVSGGAWSAAAERSLVPLGGLPLAITEVMYHPAGTIGIDPGLEAGLEFVEITNVGTESVPLDGVALTNGVSFEFANGGIDVLASGASVLVVRDRALFERVYGTSLPVAGQFAGSLDNSGETLELSLRGTVLHRFRYDDAAPWPSLADGAGRSLEIHHYELPASAAASWGASAQVGGTPGSWMERVPTSDPFAASSSQHGLYWRHQGVFGSYHLTGTALVYHRHHAWLAVVGNEQSCWLYDYQLGWLYTNASLYPILWSAGRQAWLYYWNGTQQPRWFFDYAQGQWFDTGTP